MTAQPTPKQSTPSATPPEEVPPEPATLSAPPLDIATLLQPPPERPLPHESELEMVTASDDLFSAPPQQLDPITEPSPTPLVAHSAPERDPDLFGRQEQEKNIHLNFEGADLKNFIEYIADMRKINIITDKAVSGNKISLNFRNPVSIDGAWNTFLTILEMANFSIIKFKNGPDKDGKPQYVYRVMPKDKKLTQPLPTFIGVDPETLPDSDAPIRYVAFLNNISIQDVQPLLQSMLSQPHTLIAQPNVNGFIIGARAHNIKSAMKVIQELDQTGLQESVYVMKLKRANARDVKELFDSLIKKPDGNPLARLLGKQAENSTEYFSPSTKMIAEERTNSLIMLGTRQSLEKVRSFIVEHIDTELKQTESPLRIYELQHTNVKDIIEILREVTDSQNFQSQAGQQAARYGAIRDGVKHFKSMKFQPDVEGNRLLVSCTDNDDWESLKKTIRMLDTPQPQVAIQMMIVTVSANSIKELGGQLRNKNHGTIGKNIDFQSHPIGGANTYETDGGTPISLLGDLLQGLTSPARGSSILSFGKIAAGEGGIWAVFKALSSTTDATVISQPFLTAANRSSSTLVVGESTYIKTQEAVGSSTNSSTGFSAENADTTITLTPQINPEGVIILAVDVSIEEFVPGSSGRSKQKKTLKTKVTMANGQVLALGGMVKTKVTESAGETPGLGKIPLLGWLAKSKNRTTEKEYVLMFLCPTILKPRTSPGIGMYTKMKLHGAAKDVEEAVQTEKTNCPVHNWFFNPTGEGYSHKVVDFANARYQPNNVDIRHDPYYRTTQTPKVQPALDLNTQAASPSQHWRRHQEEKAAELAPLPPARTVIIPPEEPKERPATLPLGAEKVTLPAAPQPAPLPDPAPERAVAPSTENEQSISFAKALTTPTAQPKPASPEKTTKAPVDGTLAISPAATTLEEAIENKRAKLRTLLSGNSLSDLLSKAPAPTEPKSEQLAQSQSTPPSHEQDSVMLSRRQGITNLLSVPTVDESTTVADNHTARANLRSFLGSKA